MKPVWIALCLVAACSTNDLDKQKAEMERQAHASDPPPSAPLPPRQMGSALPPPTTKQPAAPMVDPTTPEELDHALKQAMIDGRDKDVLHLCDLGKLDTDPKANPQSLLGCTLSACRIKNEELAHRYSGPLKKDYRDAATKVCIQNSVSL
jgi:hypothetical protein|nr:hypothetical protein [Kofleriaceae bacterium]